MKKKNINNINKPLRNTSSKRINKVEKHYRERNTLPKVK